jgi:N-acetylmuramoyl-L-alanine amidase
MTDVRRGLARKIVIGTLTIVGAVLLVRWFDRKPGPLVPAAGTVARTAPAATTPAPPPPPPPPAFRVPAATAAKPARRLKPQPRAGVSPDPLPPQGRVPPAPSAIQALLPACCSEPRNGRQIDAIVLHSTEQPDAPHTGDLAKLTRYFAAAQKSSHVADNADGASVRLVADDRIAYHATYWNVSTVGIEQVGFSAFSRLAWMKRPAQLETTARWIAHWAGLYRIPIRRCVVAGLRYNPKSNRVIAGQIVQRGVCTHAQVDPHNRDDPGAGYPFDAVLARARAIVAATR